ncbi:MAG: hypothetical protein NVS2B16_07860 [Chloroflexota bacterium]
MQIDILLVEDHPHVRDIVRVVLSSQQRLHVLGEAGDGYSALAQVEKLHPDVVIMDIELPQLNGLQATRQIRQRFTSVHVVMLSTHEHTHYVRESLQAGAGAYVVKRAMGRDLVIAVEAVAAGQQYLSPTIPSASRQTTVHSI